MGNE
jgi:hypothetical protein